MYNKEIVICAAIWVQDDKKRPYQPTNIPSGTVFCGLRHPSILSQLAAYGIAHKNRSVQGFLTSKNRFLTREEASELVRNNNQEMVVDDNYRLKVYTGNCIIQLNVNPKDPSESFFDVYDRDEMKLIYGIKISILKEMFII